MSLLSIFAPARFLTARHLDESGLAVQL